jgi:type I restriction enzyme S subunit
MCNGPYPVMGSTSIIGCHNNYKMDPPGVVTGRSGSLGTVQYVTEKYWPHNTVLWVKDFKGNFPRYVYYYLQTLNLGRFNSGAGVPTLNRNDLDTLEIPVHPFPTQRKIAAILSAYDDLIENNTRRIKILEEMAQALYREWFVKFRFPGHEKVKMVESELGMVPEGWEVIKLFDVARLHRGKSYRSLDLVEEGGLPFLNLKCIERGGGFRYDGIKRYQGKFKETQTAKSGDILMAITDMTQERRLVAHTARVPVLDGNISVISMDLIKIEPMPEMHEEYIYGMLRFSEFADKVKQYANGANVLHLSPDRVADFKFALPPSNLRSQYSAFCSNLYQQCDNLNIKNPNLRRTRDLLLPKLISGELNVQNFDINTINNKT